MPGKRFGKGWSPPQEVVDNVEFHWWHVPAGGSLLLCCLSEQPSWYVGHFDRGRMRICAGAGCDLCALGVGRQLRFVLCAAEVTTRRVGVLEVGSSVGYSLRDRALGNGGLRGTIVELSKASRSKHGRMEVHFVDQHPGAALLCLEPLDLAVVLEQTWRRQEAESGVERHR